MCIGPGSVIKLMVMDQSAYKFVNIIRWPHHHIPFSMGRHSEYYYSMNYVIFAYANIWCFFLSIHFWPVFAANVTLYYAIAKFVLLLLSWSCYMLVYVCACAMCMHDACLYTWASGVSFYILCVSLFCILYRIIWGTLICLWVRTTRMCHIEIV